MPGHGAGQRGRLARAPIPALASSFWEKGELPVVGSTAGRYVLASGAQTAQPTQPRGLPAGEGSPPPCGHGQSGGKAEPPLFGLPRICHSEEPLTSLVISG